MNDMESPDLIEEARKTFSGPITFLKSAPTLEFLPDMAVNEVAFAGRSNVGKSSLLNALTNRNNLARTSNTPCVLPRPLRRTQPSVSCSGPPQFLWG